MAPRLQILLRFVCALAFVALASTPTAADGPRGATIVDPAVLEPLIPMPAGWKLARQQSKMIVSPEYTHSFAEVLLEQESMTVRLTIADTGGNEASLMALATMVMTLPENFAGEVPPSTSIRRMTIAGMPAAERWSLADGNGEISVVIARRFVVSAEGTKLDSLETIRRMVDAVDFKKVAALN